MTYYLKVYAGFVGYKCDVMESVETSGPLVVVQEVAGSIPVSHPNFPPVSRSFMTPRPGLANRRESHYPSAMTAIAFRRAIFALLLLALAGAAFGDGARAPSYDDGLRPYYARDFPTALGVRGPLAGNGASVAQ